MIYSLRPLDICISPVGASKPQSRHCSFGKSDPYFAYKRERAWPRARIKKPCPSNKRLLVATCPIRCVFHRENQRRAIADTRVHRPRRPAGHLALAPRFRSTSRCRYSFIARFRVLFQRRRVPRTEKCT